MPWHICLPDKWAGQACKKCICMRNNWSSTWKLLVHENRQKLNMTVKPWCLGEISDSLWNFGESASDSACVWSYFGSIWLGGYYHIGDGRWITCAKQLLLFCVVFHFVFLYIGVSKITLKIWERRNLLNMDCYISWWHSGW